MGRTADVSSIEALGTFREALCKFGEQALNALTSADMEVRRTLDWVEREQLAYWKQQIKRSQQELAQARSELFRKKLFHTHDHTPDVSFEREAMRIAQQKLQQAETKVAKIKKLLPILQQAVGEYHGQSRPFGDMLGGDLRHSLAMLDRMVQALEAYLAIAPPSFSPATTPGFLSAALAAAPEPTPGVSEAPEGSDGEEDGRGGPMNLSSDAAKLQAALKLLRVDWETATESWRDQVCADFESNRLTPLEQRADATIRAMGKLAEVLAMVRREVGREPE